MNKEYISFHVAEEVNERLGSEYCYKFHHKTKKCWRYPVSGSGGHPCAPYINDWDYDDDPFEEYDDTWFAFSWKELYDLMNVCIIGDYRKVEFESIEDIDEFALELNEYIKEQREKSYERN